MNLRCSVRPDTFFSFLWSPHFVAQSFIFCCWADCFFEGFLAAGFFLEERERVPLLPALREGEVFVAMCDQA